MSNVSDSIKIACDFLDAANLAETRNLAADFRLHRIATKTGDDVLQFYNTLWHCWCSLSEKEGKVRSRASRVRPAHPQHPPENYSAQASTRQSRMNAKRKEKRRLEVLGLRIPIPGNFNCDCPICPRKFTRAGLIDHL